MLLTTRPSIAARDVFEACCVGIVDAHRKARLVPNSSKIGAAAADYATAAQQGRLQTIVATSYEPYGTATVGDFVWLYDQRLVRSRVGRGYYEAIRTGNRDERCALCNAKQASTLDHHLPKAEHPIFAVTPENLLPACRDCNAAKLASLRPTLNTYFDDLGPGRWLSAVIVIRGGSFVPDFELAVQPTWSPALADRAQAHFEVLRLRTVYSFEASRHLVGIRDQLAGLLDRGGAAAVQLHLQEAAASWAANDPNSWQAAIYEACAASTWFCGGGFRG
ncbi:HNH endonuclease [Cellulomonas biazotea]|uniref:HNH endonuclease n=1 Tax=Cellulomonas biazotea TaxID=1709 RepID=A0A402DND0_9CELL|nr:hypothetical protein [Cellulomonas biazotea]GCE75634.1 HNH endonuclease [Cellulomonas biazotea]